MKKGFLLLFFLLLTTSVFGKQGSDMMLHSNGPIAMGLFGLFHIGTEKKPKTAMYSVEEMDRIEAYIEKNFGKIDYILHDESSNDVHIDICVIPPSETRDYYTLVTMGMGAKKMKVPYFLAEQRLHRAELVLFLPSTWQMTDEAFSDEKWYWPIRMIKTLSVLPFYEKNWLGKGHTVGSENAFAENTELCGVILDTPKAIAQQPERFCLSKGKPVNFYQIIPVYQNEIDYKEKNRAEALLTLLREISPVIDVQRKSVCP
ncbi:MAG: suppressor of fused domain protein [Bacteroidaceae bacterium]|nr:suppressor of fused domain protein [Bacteroidaceae bacterium]